MAKQADSAFEGTPILLKRTKLDINDTTIPAGGTSSPQTKIDNDGALKFGEPIYLQDNDQVIIGDGTTKTEEGITRAKKTSEYTKGIEVVPIAVMKHGVYANAGNVTESNAKQCTLTDDQFNALYPRLFNLTTKDSNGTGIPKDALDNVIEILATDKWYELDNLDEPDLNKPITNPTTSTIFPRVQPITITKLDTNTTPFVGLSLTQAQLGTATTVKALKKAFGNITAVASSTTANTLLVYCGVKAVVLPTNEHLYIDVLGG